MAAHNPDGFYFTGKKKAHKLQYICIETTKRTNKQKKEILSMPSLYCFFPYIRCHFSQEVCSYTPPKCLVSAIFMGLIYLSLINL